MSIWRGVLPALLTLSLVSGCMEDTDPPAKAEAGVADFYERALYNQILSSHHPNDGRVIYSRWEYTDKPLWRLQKLWTINPDGTNLAVYWGNRDADGLIYPLFLREHEAGWRAFADQVVDDDEDGNSNGCRVGSHGAPPYHRTVMYPDDLGPPVNSPGPWPSPISAPLLASSRGSDGSPSPTALICCGPTCRSWPRRSAKRCGLHERARTW